MATPQVDSLIDIENVTKVYSEDDSTETVTALKDIDLQIQDGEFLSIIGPSGCGKSTLLRIVSGLLKPTGGTLRIDGGEIETAVSDVGFVFQSPVLLDWRTVSENVMFPYEALHSGDNSLPHAKEYYADRAEQLLELVGLADFKESYPNQLSGGMQQRVAIVRALLTDPSIMLMDEPFGALDEFTRTELNQELLEIYRETQKTILFVTHNIHEAAYLSDRVVVLSDRPGTVKNIISIDIERPRDPGVQDDDEYIAYLSDLRRELGLSG